MKVLTNSSIPTESFSSFPMLGGHSRLSKWILFTYGLISFKVLCFCFLLCCAACWVSLHMNPSVMQFPPGNGVSMLLSLLPFSMWSLFPVLCKDCSLTPRHFRKTFSMCRCRFHVSKRGGEFRVFLSWTLNQRYFRSPRKHCDPLSLP